MQIRQYVWKCLQQFRRGSLVGRLSAGVVLGLLFLSTTLSIGVPEAQARTSTPCSASDQTYIVVVGNTLSGIAHLYRTSWPALASYNHIHNPDLIYINQAICIPARASVGSNFAPVHPATSGTPTTTPQTQSPPQTQGGATTIPDMINQVFGPYGPAAIRVATCESGLNPNAIGPQSAGGYPAGLFQIMYTSTWAGTSQAANSPYDPMANILAAHEIFARDGYSWREWSCQP